MLIATIHCSTSISAPAATLDRSREGVASLAGALVKAHASVRLGFSMLALDDSLWPKLDSAYRDQEIPRLLFEFAETWDGEAANDLLPAIRSLCERTLFENLQDEGTILHLLSGIAAADGLFEPGTFLYYGSEQLFRRSACDWRYDYGLYGSRVAIYAEENPRHRH